jgi:hypothetical protein
VKVLLKLAVMLLIIYACAHAAMAAWTYYQLKDAAQQAIIFGAHASTAQLHEEILRRAVALEIPIAAEAIEVTRDGPRTSARASYTQPVELFPNYKYPITFSFTVEGLTVGATKASDVLAPAPAR